MSKLTLEQYFQKSSATPEERKAALRWVSEGNEIGSNPFFMYNEDGSTMDFLSALRIAHEQKNEYH